MKKLINDVNNVEEEMILGLVKSAPQKLAKLDDYTVVVRKDKKQGKVALVSGGGSGHEPAHAGYVGIGMLDAAVAGTVFTSPAPDAILEGMKAVATDEGVLCLVKNYQGDVMNFEMAIELAADEGIKADYVVVNDDVAVKDSLYTTGRRGVAGTIFVHKIAGAKAEAGGSLEDVKAVAEKVIANVRTMGMAIEPCTVPAAGKPGFTLNDEAMAKKMESEKDYLTELDNEIADGDHGINLARGFAAVEEKLPSLAGKDIGTILKTAGMQLVSKVGGASGALYGTFFMKAGMAAKGLDTLDGAALVKILGAGVEGIKSRGKATTGEKTMLDAWVPALEALDAGLTSGKSLADALGDAVGAAEEGVEYTKTIIATKGRASYIGERSLGHQDPGATSTLYMLQVLQQAVQG